MRAIQHGLQCYLHCAFFTSGGRNPFSQELSKQLKVNTGGEGLISQFCFRRVNIRGSGGELIA